MDYQTINKDNLPKCINTLKYLTSILVENDIKYYLSASGLEYILGSNTYPYDIDLFMHKENVKKVYELLKDYSVSDLHKWEDRLIEFQGKYNGIPFEICEWEKEPKKLINKKFKDFEVSIIG